MKTLGLLGGMTYNATAIYYNLINRHVQQTLGGATSAPLLLHSFNHAELTPLFTTAAWPAVTSRFVTAAHHLRTAGASALVICCNIGHKVADELERQSGLPVLHTADYTGALVRTRGLRTVALLGTAPVMDPDGFFARRLRGFGVEVVVPGPKTREGIQRMIFEELGAGRFHDGQRGVLMKGIREGREQGAEGVVFACTELQFVVKPGDVDVPLWDTMEAHAIGVAEWALADAKGGR